jgi:uncharacterized damage-inducible protein DinB
MKLEEIKELYLYNEWANRKYLDLVKTLDDEKFSIEIKSSFKSIRETIAHLIATEWIWLQRWLGINPGSPPDWADKPTVETLVEKFNSIVSERNNFFKSLNDNSLSELRNYNLLSGKAGQNTLQEMLQHVVNHSTYHRGQLATLVRQIDEVPPSTDLIIFYRERKGMV